jgi:hypothetical protein
VTVYEEDSRHIYVFARYYRAKLLLKDPLQSGKEVFTSEKSAGIAKAKLLVAEACRYFFWLEKEF